MELFYNKNHCKIYYIKEIECVYLDWHGFAMSEDFREACNFSLELMVKNKSSRMIADNSKAKVVIAADRDWMNEDWFPRAIVAGFKTSAVVVAQDIFRDISVKKIVNNLDSGVFTAQFFQDYESAYHWHKENFTH
ncbi:MAG: hypothetical protein MUC49_10340 [Raineya sp.]|jgi:hypothetical protein|nr:hypothetical protein [Raineya sp.]